MSNSKIYNTNIYYAIEIIIGASIVWGVSLLLNEGQYVSWGLFAFLGTLERDMRYRKLLLKQRFIHTLFATSITAICLFLFGPGYAAFYTSLILAMIFGNCFTYYPAGWKLLPATVAILNYLAIILANDSPTQATLLLGVRLFETVLGACLALLIQLFYMRYFKKTPPIL